MKEIIIKNIFEQLGDTTQAEFARKINVSPQQLGDWLSGRYNISIKNLEKIAHGLDCDVSELLKK